MDYVVADEDSTILSFVYTCLLDLGIGSVLLGVFVLLRASPAYDWCFATRTHYRLRLADPWKREAPPSRLPSSVLETIKLLWRISPDDEVAIIGLDGVILLRFFRLAIKFFLSCSVFGLVVLLQVNLSGSLYSSDTFAAYTMDNLADGSSLLWLHFLGSYLFTGLLMFLLYREYVAYVLLRHAHYLTSTRRHNITSIHIKGIPNELKNDTSFADFFRSLYPSDYGNSVVIKSTSNLENLVDKRTSAYWALDRALARLQWQNTSPAKYHLLSSTDKDVFICKEKLRQLNDATQQMQAGPHMYSKVGFVTFKSLGAKVLAFNTAKALEPRRLSAHTATEPLDVIWKGLRMGYWELLLRSTFVWSLMFALMVTYMIPIAFFASITELDTLVQKFSWLEGIVTSSTFIAALLSGWLPTMALMLFNVFLPHLIRVIVVFCEGCLSESQIDHSVFTKYFWFQIFNFYLFTIVSESVVSTTFEMISSPGLFFTYLGDGLTSFSVYFIEYIFLATVVLFPWRLLRAWPLVRGWFMKRFYVSSMHDLHKAEEPGCLRYGNDVPMYLLIFMVGITYATISPLCLPVCVLFFTVGLFVIRYHLIFVLHPLYENGGCIFPRLFSRMILGMIIAQSTMIGLFFMKGCFYQAVLLIPSVFTTFAYHYYVKSSFAQVADKPTQAEITTFDRTFNWVESRRTNVTAFSVRPHSLWNEDTEEGLSSETCEMSVVLAESSVQSESSRGGEYSIMLSRDGNSMDPLESEYTQPCLKAPYMDPDQLFSRYPNAL